MKITRSAESSHWYHRDGTPCHEITAKTTGLPRPTTVADARKLNLIPSVTNILNMKTKPALVTWLQDNAIRAAISTARGPDEPEDAWIARIVAESARIGREAAEWGTLLHAEAEKLHTTGALDCGPEVAPYLEGYAEWFRSNVAKVIDTEKTVVAPLGYAGRLDLHAMLKDGTRAVIDLKSQKVLGKKAPGFYLEWAMQLAAYADCLEPGAALISVVIPSDTPGPVYVKRWENGLAALAAFHACFRLWCFEKNYTP
jgi:hypothetical protein